MTTLTFKELIANPPAMQQTSATLPDGRKYELYKLPMGALLRVAELSKIALDKKEELPIKVYGGIAAQAVLGRPPKEKEVDQFIDVMGSDTIAHIYRQAISFSQLGVEAIEEAKKD